MLTFFGGFCIRRRFEHLCHMDRATFFLFLFAKHKGVHSLSELQSFKTVFTRIVGILSG